MNDEAMYLMQLQQFQQEMSPAKRRESKSDKPAIPVALAAQEQAF